MLSQVGLRGSSPSSGMEAPPGDDGWRNDGIRRKPVQPLRSRDENSDFHIDFIEQILTYLTSSSKCF